MRRAAGPGDDGREPRGVRRLGNPVLRDIATRHDASAVQITLAWVLRLDNVCAIPRSSRPEHTYENRAALEIHLDHAAPAVTAAPTRPSEARQAAVTVPT